MKCWTQAKLALPAGGDAVDPALVVAQPFAAPVAVVERRVGEDEIGLEVRVQVAVEGVGRARPRLASMPRIARFILASRQVVGFDSWPKIEMSLRAGRRAPRRTAPTARTCRPSRSRGRRRGPCRARSSRPAADDAARRCRTRRRACLRRWRTGRGSIRRRGRACPWRGRLVAEADVGDQVDQLAEPRLVERRAGVVLGQHAFERSGCRSRSRPSRRR